MAKLTKSLRRGHGSGPRPAARQAGRRVRIVTNTRGPARRVVARTLASVAVEGARREWNAIECENDEQPLVLAAALRNALHRHAADADRLDAPDDRLVGVRRRPSASAEARRPCATGPRRRSLGCSRAAAGTRPFRAPRARRSRPPRPVVTPGLTGPPSAPRNVMSTRPLRSASSPPIVWPRPGHERR